IIIGHAITIPTGLAVAEIATNLKVEGGGAYYIISRSFGTTLGGTIGISLYFSQAISVAFYLIAFSEAFRPLFPWIESQTGFTLDIRVISIPAALILFILILKRGANIGVAALWIVVSILAISLAMFFLGSPTVNAPAEVPLTSKVDNAHDFFLVFAFIFPAFTGMIAGVGLSGDLRDTRKSIPLGTLSATITGMVVYILVVIKLAFSASPLELASDQFIMGKIAIWEPIILIGLAAATLSSAIGSILVAPRTLQALGGDNILPTTRWNRFLNRGQGETNEPLNATILTSALVILFLMIGKLDFVAQIISMFFMITYGSLCAVSFLEHFAGNPSYRPTFRSKWYLSLIGALASIIMMFQMSTIYATLAVIAMTLIYLGISKAHAGERDLTAVIKGVLFQMTRKLQIVIQKREAQVEMTNWRPSLVAISKNSLTRLDPFDMLRWITHYYGFGSFIHYIKGSLNEETNRGARETLSRLIEQAQYSRAGMYVDTIISPSFKTAVAQIVQIPGIAGMDNNSILFEFSQDKTEDLKEIIEGCDFAAIADFNICILRTSERHFGYKRKIHIWLTPGDLRNANLMILLAYILVGHPEWKSAEIRLFATSLTDKIRKDRERMRMLVAQGLILISPKNIQILPLEKDMVFDELVEKHSEIADLVITGFSLSKMREDKGDFLQGFANIKDILFVRAGQEILITQPEEEPEPAEENVDTQEKPEKTVKSNKTT
ncbi:MAG: amino acid permease, partial [Chloroflexota bacterium]